MSQGDNLNLAESFKARDVNNRSFRGVATIELVINQLSLRDNKSTISRPCNKLHV